MTRAAIVFASLVYLSTATPSRPSTTTGPATGDDTAGSATQAKARASVCDSPSPVAGRRIANVLLQFWTRKVGAPPPARTTAAADMYPSLPRSLVLTSLIHHCTPHGHTHSLHCRASIGQLQSSSIAGRPTPSTLPWRAGAAAAVSASRRGKCTNATHTNLLSSYNGSRV